MQPNIVHIIRNMSALEGGIPGSVLNLISFLSIYNHKIISLSKNRLLSKNIPNIEINSKIVMSVPITIDENLIPSYRLRKWIISVLQLTFSIRLVKSLKKVKANLVHCHYNRWIDLQTIAILKKAKLPIIWTIHVLPPEDEKELKRWQLAIDLIVNSDHGRVVAVSQAIVNHLVELGICRSQDIKVIYNGIDLKRFIDFHSRINFLRSKLKIPQYSIVFGTVGSLKFEKGHDIFIESAALLLQKIKNGNIFFVIVGSGPMADEWRKRIKYYGLEHHFHLIGFLSDIRPFLNDLDVFVFPSRKEGFPLALLEALASGLPCIATQVGGIPEILGEDGGLLVPPESPEALAEAMYKMLDPKVRAEYSMRARKVVERFSMDKTAEQYKLLYQELLGI